LLAALAAWRRAVIVLSSVVAAAFVPMHTEYIIGRMAQQPNGHSARKGEAT